MQTRPLTKLAAIFPPFLILIATASRWVLEFILLLFFSVYPNFSLNLGVNLCYFHMFWKIIYSPWAAVSDVNVHGRTYVCMYGICGLPVVVDKKTTRRVSILFSFPFLFKYGATLTQASPAWELRYYQWKTNPLSKYLLNIVLKF